MISLVRVQDDTVQHEAHFPARLPSSSIVASVIPFRKVHSWTFEPHKDNHRQWRDSHAIGAFVSW